jgi:hypothetical protein
VLAKLALVSIALGLGRIPHRAARRLDEGDRLAWRRPSLDAETAAAVLVLLVGRAYEREAAASTGKSQRSEPRAPIGDERRLLSLASTCI